MQTYDVCWDSGGTKWLHGIVNYENWVYHDQFGTPHYFGGVTNASAPDVCDPPVDNPSFTETAYDGSGYTLVVTNYTQATIITPSGAVTNPPVNSPDGNGTAQDSNGNKVTTSGGTFTDTLGTTALSVTGSRTPTSPLTFTYTDPSSNSANVVFHYTAKQVRTYFQCSNISEYGPQTVNLVTSVDLPDGTTYNLTYEPSPDPNYPSAVTGRLASVQLPTGGTISYSYTGANHGVQCSDGSTSGLQRVTPDGTWQYSRTLGTGAASTNIVTDPQNNQARLQFQGIYQTKSETYQGSTAGTLLKTVDTCYNGNNTNCTATAVTLPISRRTVFSSLPNTSGKEAEVNTLYNSYGLPTETDEYDFGTGAPGALLRKTVTTYGSLGNNIQDRPSTVQVYDGSNNLKAQSTYGYDQTSLTATSAPQHVAVSGARGNVTTIGRWLDTSNSTLNTTFTYDDTGNVLTTTDPGGHTTSVAYSSTFGYAYPTQVTKPTTTSPSTATHVTSANYDSHTGLVISSTDENSKTTSYAYDSSLRPTSVSYPDGGSATITYTNATTIDRSDKISATQNLTTKMLLDGMGRTIQKQVTSDPSGTVLTDTSYDSVGRVSCVANPYRGTKPSDGNTCYSYDTLGRATTVTQPGTTGTVTSSYSQNCVTVTDAAGNQRKNCSDGLGRLTSVWEPDSSGALTWETDYQYNTLDRLTRIDQKGGGSNWRTRTMTYDSFGRLLSETNPESGLTCYGSKTGSTCNADGYDADGDILKRTDARGVMATNAYDQLHRVRSTSYSDGTATTSIEYDQSSIWGVTLQNPTGRVTHVSNGSNAERLSSYDSMGRLISQIDCISNCGSGSYNTSIAYNLAGNVAEIDYPSGRQVTYTYNAASQPITAAFANASGGSKQYVSSASYSPAGAITSLALGNGLSETYTYNNLMQMATAKLSSTSPALTAFNRSYGYLDGSGHDNGNLLSITDSLSSARTQLYSYDRLNRVASAKTQTTTGTDCWGQTFTYDAFGNITTVGYPAGYSGCVAPQPTFSINTNNQITGTGYSYDLAGNMTGDGSNNYQLDGEGRMKSVNSTLATYSYDVSSQRVEKTTGGASTQFILLGSQVIAERKSGDWSDYVYLGGRMIAKADSYEDRVRITGTNSSTGQYTIFKLNSAAGYNGYVVQSGDTLFLRQYQATGSHGGMIVKFSDGTTTNWDANANDQDGNNLNNDAAQNTWHYRRVNLGAFAGKTISEINLVCESSTGAITWNIYYNDIAILSADGTVRPVYNRTITAPGYTISSSGGVTGQSLTVSHNTGQMSAYDSTTTYFHGDHLGSGRMMSSVNGYPVWQATYLPFGYERNPQATPNSWKFTSYRRDEEGSQLDYASYRYYSSTMGRFMRPDPAGMAAVDLSSPQSLNRYAYVMNNPTNATDPLGLCDKWSVEVGGTDLMPTYNFKCIDGKADGNAGGPSQTMLPGAGAGGGASGGNSGTGNRDGGGRSGGGGGGSLVDTLLNNPVVDFLGKASNWLPGACSGGAFAFGGVNAGKQDKAGAGQFALVSADYVPDRGWTTEGGSLTEGFNASGTGGGTLLPQGELIGFVPVAHGKILGAKAEGGAFFGLNYSRVPVSIGLYGEVEAGKRGLINAAAGGGTYLNFTNASTCVEMYLAGRR